MLLVAVCVSLVWPHDTFPLSFCQSEMDFVVSAWLPFHVTEFQKAFLDAAVEFVNFSKVPSRPYGYIYHISIMVSHAVQNEGLMHTNIQQSFLAMHHRQTHSCTHKHTCTHSPGFNFQLFYAVCMFYLWWLLWAVLPQPKDIKLDKQELHWYELHFLLNKYVVIHFLRATNLQGNLIFKWVNQI